MFKQYTTWLLILIAVAATAHEEAISGENSRGYGFDARFQDGSVWFVTAAHLVLDNRKMAFPGEAAAVLPDFEKDLIFLEIPGRARMAEKIDGDSGAPTTALQVRPGDSGRAFRDANGRIAGVVRGFRPAQGGIAEVIRLERNPPPGKPIPMRIFMAWLQDYRTLAEAIERLRRLPDANETLQPEQVAATLRPVAEIWSRSDSFRAYPALTAQFRRLGGELARLCAWLGVAPDGSALKATAGAYSPTRWEALLRRHPAPDLIWGDAAWGMVGWRAGNGRFLWVSFCSEGPHACSINVSAWAIDSFAPSHDLTER